MKIEIAARRLRVAGNVQLVLPVAGICETDVAEDGAGRRGGRAPQAANACSAADNVARLGGKKGYDCGAAA